MMKLVFTGYTRTSQYTDPQQWLDRIAGYTGILECLAKEHSVHSIEQINHEGLVSKKEVNYHFIDTGSDSKHFPVRLHSLIKCLQPDIVFINGFIFPLQVFQLKKILGKKARIVILHRAERPFTGVKKWIQKMAGRSVDAYLFTSASFSEQWKNNIDTSRIHEVIQASSVFYPVNRNLARDQLGLGEGAIYLSVGDLVPRKDPLTIVKAFIQFLEHRTAARLYLVYQNAELLEQVQTTIKDYQHQIKLVGAVPHRELLLWYNAADFFITASLYEGSGVALSEAMSCGCIPLTSDFISFKKMTGDKCGLMFSAGNENELAEVLKKSGELDTETERSKVLDQFRRELSFEAIAKKINEVIGKIS